MAFDNLQAAMKLAGVWKKFTSSHPKFPAFLNAVKARGLQEGVIVEVIITEPDGQKIETSLKLNQSDIDALNELKAMKPNG